MWKKFFIISILSFFMIIMISCANETNAPIDTPDDPTYEDPIIEEACEHIYKDGKCTLCGELCTHTFDKGKCKVCGYVCPHNEISQGICSVCGYPIYEECEHMWRKGVCNICGYICPHEHIYDGFCLDCDVDFSVDCDHEWEDGVCKKCTMICHHNFKDSVCQNCGFVCTHEGLKCGETCRVCYYEFEHQIVEGKCVLCGKRFDYVTEIPSNFLNTNCPEKGTVEKVVFQSYDYANNRPYENTFFVYLPYGYYDNTDEYNVFYLTHGSGENAAYWLAQLSYAG